MRKITFCLLGLMLSNLVFSQIRNFNLTLSPTAEYVFWESDLGLENGFLYGGKLGVGLGQHFELRGIYMLSDDVKTDYKNSDELEDITGIDLIDNNSLQLRRYGGEIKTTIGKGTLSPYLILGGGVQSLEADVDGAEKNEQIYLSGGLGIVVRLSDRIVFNVEGKNTTFRMNPSAILTTDNLTTLGLTRDDFGNERYSNWSVSAALQLHLGGEKTSEDSETLYSSLKSFQGTLEPMVGNISFDNSLGYRDTWLAGVSGGFDLGRYIGIRAFYWKALEDGETTKFDDLAMYGGELRMKLNQNSREVVPYLLLGGGKIDVKSSYKSNNPDVLEAKDNNFIMAGMGLNVPIFRDVDLFGSVRGIYTSNSDAENITSTDEINTSVMYSGGIRFRIGRKTYIDEEYQRKLDEANQEYQQKLEEIRQEKDSLIEENKKAKIKIAESQESKKESVEIKEENKESNSEEKVIIEKTNKEDSDNKSEEKQYDINLSSEQFIDIINAIYGTEKINTSSSSETKVEKSVEEKEQDLIRRIEQQNQIIDEFNKRVDELNNSQN
ncbi:MAG: hypothetical protein H6604_07310 [Flavobacteriales bacterium]|nr:hypothetical protein [Flavobacteriales bacterium]